MPDHGMHIVAYLRHGRSDVAVERAAAARGVVARAISPLYTAAPPRSGLLLGFSGFAPEAIAPAVARLAGASPISRGVARYVLVLAPGDRLVEGSIGCRPLVSGLLGSSRSGSFDRGNWTLYSTPWGGNIPS